MYRSVERNIPHIVIGLFLIVASQCIAQPRVGFEVKITRFLLEEGMMFAQGTWNTDIYYEYYTGVGSDIIIEFSRAISIRSNLFELKKLDGGGTCMCLLSNPGADLLVMIPITRRISPHLFLGFTYNRFSGLSYNDYRGIDPVYELTIGIGSEYRLKEIFHLFAEVDVFNKFQAEFKRVPLEDMISRVDGESLGILRINVGARFYL